MLGFPSWSWIGWIQPAISAYPQIYRGWSFRFISGLKVELGSSKSSKLSLRRYLQSNTRDGLMDEILHIHLTGPTIQFYIDITEDGDYVLEILGLKLEKWVNIYWSRKPEAWNIGGRMKVTATGLLLGNTDCWQERAFMLLDEKVNGTKDEAERIGILTMLIDGKEYSRICQRAYENVQAIRVG